MDESTQDPGATPATGSTAQATGGDAAAPVQPRTRPAVTGLPFAVAMLRSATIAATIALAPNVGIMLLAKALGADFKVEQPTGLVLTVTVVEVIGSTISAILIGSLMLWLMSYLRGGLMVWLVMVGVIGVGSMLIPLIRAEQIGTGLALASMHLTTLAAALLFPRRTAKASGAL